MRSTAATSTAMARRTNVLKLSRAIGRNERVVSPCRTSSRGMRIRSTFRWQAAAYQWVKLNRNESAYAASMRSVERNAYQGRARKPSETFGPVMTTRAWRARRAPR